MSRKRHKKIFPVLPGATKKSLVLETSLAGIMRGSDDIYDDYDKED